MTDFTNMWQCLLLDLHDDAALIQAYCDRHGAVPPAVLSSIRAAGIEAMDIYQLDDRLVMMMRTGPDYDPDAKAVADASDPAVVAWEAAMSRLQRPLPSARPGEKWLLAERIFSLDEQA
jgi:L-rhamnose mutarotase